MVSAWSLNLDLVTGGNRRRGSMTIYRMYSERHLQLDINWLTSVFPVALADALDRAISHAMRDLPPVEQPAALIAAHAQAG
jgi:hypothetical protein